MAIFNFFSGEKNDRPQIKQANVDEVASLHQLNSHIFIDVREPEEWEQGVIPGALKISMGEVEDNLEKMDQEKEYIIVCRSGSRSYRIAEIMSEAGFKNIINFGGGMLDWYAQNLPLESP